MKTLERVKDLMILRNTGSCIIKSHFKAYLCQKSFLRLLLQSDAFVKISYQVR